MSDSLKGAISQRFEDGLPEGVTTADLHMYLQQQHPVMVAKAAHTPDRADALSRGMVRKAEAAIRRFHALVDAGAWEEFAAQHGLPSGNRSSSVRVGADAGVWGRAVEAVPSAVGAEGPAAMEVEPAAMEMEPAEVAVAPHVRYRSRSWGSADSAAAASIGDRGRSRSRDRSRSRRRPGDRSQTRRSGRVRRAPNPDRMYSGSQPSPEAEQQPQGVEQ